MNILYVATLVQGFEDILKGEKEAKGLPTFILPLKKLLEQGHSVDIILFSKFEYPINIKVSWIQNENIIGNIHNDLTIGNKVKRRLNFVKTIIQGWKTINHALKRKHYDFVYCHGKAAILGNILANLRGIPCGYRLYGTVHLYDDIMQFGKNKAARKNLTYYLIFKMKKEFLLITNEGSHGDIVYEYWKPKKNEYPLYFWLNGVDIESIKALEGEGEIPKEPYLFMANRIDNLKRQDAAIEMLNLLHKENINIHLYLAGHVDCEKYVLEVKELIKKYELSSYVHFMGPISGKYIKKMAYYSKATIIWNAISNRGNVFYEVFSTGGLIVSVNDGSLDDFVTRNENIFLADKIEDAVGYLKKLIDMSEDERNKMREKAVNQAVRIISDWDTRISKEIQLLQKYESCS